jgi:hypothetical protein
MVYGGKLCVEDQGIEGDVAPDAVAMEPVEGAGEGVPVEVGSAGPSVEPLETQVDGVGTRLDGGVQAGFIARRGEDLGGEAGKDHGRGLARVASPACGLRC